MKRETLLIEKGALGIVRELPKDGLVIYPFTLFIGKQGTGKSLFSQLIYFFRNVPFLARYYEAKLGKGAGAEKIVRAAVDELRSPRRAFALFASPTVELKFFIPSRDKPLEMKLDNKSRRVHPRASLKKEIEHLLSEKPSNGRLGNALYIPAERMLYAHARGPSVWNVFPLPSTLTIFADVMEAAAETFKNWQKGEPDTQEGRWVRNFGRKALGGEALRIGDYWKWDFGGRDQMELDMASSGQKANWPIVLLAEVLFSWRQDREIPPDFALHVEEPEIHLHPEAQVAMVKILAFLVNHGFRVLVTTHSLTVLYTVNNLLAASVLPENHVEPGLPEPEVRLKPGTAGAYFFGEDGRVVNLVDEETGLLSEADMAEVGEQLIMQLSRIEYLRAYGA